MVCCCSVSLPFCCICDLCWYGNSSESPKVEVQLCQQLAEKLLALGGHRRAEFQLGLSQHLPNFFPNYLIPSVFWSLQERSQEGELVGKALLACHRPWGRTQRALQLPLWCRGCLQLWMLFAFCFQALALALLCSTAPAFHLTPRGRRGGRTAPCIGFLRRCPGCSMNACLYVWPYFPGLHTQCCLRENRSWGGKKLQLLSSVCFSCVYLTSLFLLSSSKRFICIASLY